MSTSRRKVKYPQFSQQQARRLSREESRAEDLALIARVGKHYGTDYNAFLTSKQKDWNVSAAAIAAADKRLARY